ncbi:unnamed protein product [Bathycoccus prasinos]
MSMILCKTCKGSGYV